MQKVNEGVPPVFWCPFCGTIKIENGVPEFESPSIVMRASNLCDEAEDVLTGGSRTRELEYSILVTRECCRNAFQDYFHEEK
jgi:hypothetical protein